MATKAPVPHPSDWPTARLADIVLKIGSGATPTGGQDSYLASRSRFALVRSQNVFDRRFDVDGLAFISDEQAERLKGAVLQPKDLLLNITGDGVTFARACMVPEEILPACVNQHVSIVRVDHAVADPAYVLAYLTHPDVKNYIESFNAGGSRRAITKGHIESFHVPLPPLYEQRAIGDVLSALDNKVDLNRRMNETLEAIARALFKSWFVDFDPVGATPNPSRTRFAESIAVPIPGRFVSPALGQVPSEWRLAELGEFAEVIDCLHSKKPERRDSGQPLLQLSNIREDGLLDMTDTYWINDADYERWISRMEARGGDCVITNVGRVGAVAQVPHGLRAALGRNMTGIRCRSSYPFPTFLIQALLSESMREEIVRKMDSGTILDALNVRNIPSLRMILPTMELLDRFELLVRPIRARMERNLSSSAVLEAIRDTLLPKLISGELRIKDAERFLAKANI